MSISECDFKAISKSKLSLQSAVESYNTKSKVKPKTQKLMKNPAFSEKSAETQNSPLKVAAVEKPVERSPIYRNKSMQIKTLPEISYQKSKSLIKSNHPTLCDSLNINKYFDNKLQEKLKKVNPSDEYNILLIYLELFEKIIAVDQYGPILEKIRLKLYESLQNGIFFQENIEIKRFKELQKEILELKDEINIHETMKKSIEGKLKKLSVDNIMLQKENDKFEKENKFWMSYKKNIKMIEGIPDTEAMFKDLKLKNHMIDSLERKVKELTLKLSSKRRSNTSSFSIPQNILNSSDIL